MNQQPKYPYADGDFTVLGPEIFASKGGSVICWKGENYIRQQDVEPSRDEMTAGAMHELASAVRDLVSVVRLETADRATLQPPAPAHDAGPTVAEAAADDRAHWGQRQWGGE